MSLPLITLPNIATTSLSISLLPDVLSRVSHSHAVVRKKAIICLYRLALAYPDALKLAWPKIKERLMDDEEDTSVTTAVLNVVCELGWRRPHDFLPLAPRFFELLVDGGNNWMAIKIIKLVRWTSCLDYITFLTVIVRDFDATRTAIGAKAAPSISEYNPNNYGHVTTL